MTANTPATRKAKGRRLQQNVVNTILKWFPKLTERDVKSVPMGKSGEDIELSTAAIKYFPFAVEVKCQEKLNIWAALEQAEGENRDKNLIPMVIFKRNRSKIYCAFEFDKLIEIMGENANL